MAGQSSSILIAIEGIDGAGKTTQVRLLREALERIGEVPVVSKEPTNGPWGRIIKDSASAGRLSLDEELNAFLRDRAEHVDNLIAPSLANGRIVILDRYYFSSMAYQGSRGANVEEVRRLMESRFPIPDAVFVLDIQPEAGLHRIAHSRGEEPNHFEERGNLTRAREIFQSLNTPNVHHIDGAMSAESVHAHLLARLINGALKQRRCAKAQGCGEMDCSYRNFGKCEWAKSADALTAGAPLALALL